MSTPIEDLLDAFEMHYSTHDRQTKYTAMQRAEMVRRYDWMRNGFQSVVYDSVITSHPTSLRSLPDVAVISKAVNSLDRPSAYERVDPNQALLEDQRERATFDQVKSEVEKVRAIGSKGADEPNREQRDKVRRKVEKGDASAFERLWIRVIDEYGGDWRAAHKAIGSVPELQREG